MTMYLPNHDVRPTGAEAGEFIDAPPEIDERPPEPPRTEPGIDDREAQVGGRSDRLPALGPWPRSHPRRTV